MVGKTAISIARLVSSIVRVGCIIFLDQGRILADGHHFELLKRNGLYASVWSRYTGGLIDTEKQETAE
jgi:ATP-binding cassette subfamily B multidrug efflux pump